LFKKLLKIEKKNPPVNDGLILLLAQANAENEK
jgi:hypothetical protein